jgi:hypothetical protein
MSSGERLGEDSEARIFVEDTDGRTDFAGLFEEQNGKGHLYIWDRRTEKILDHVEIYDDLKGLLEPAEDDVQVLWSKDGARCGVTIWGAMRAIVDLPGRQKAVAPLKERSSEAIADREWLKGFGNYVNQGEFIRARQRYWKKKSQEGEPSLPLLSDNKTPIETNFIVCEAAADCMFGVFEDEGDTGYLYIYNTDKHTISHHLHVYNRSKKVDVKPPDVEVLWSENKSKCGVTIWSKMRGIIDLSKDRPARIWLESRRTPGIDDEEWLAGF